MDYHHPVPYGIAYNVASCTGCGYGLVSRLSHCQEAAEGGRIAQVTLLYTAPTAIRALQSFGDKFVTQHSRKTLRILGTVGEPINPEAWKWYHEVRSACPPSSCSGDS